MPLWEMFGVYERMQGWFTKWEQRIQGTQLSLPVSTYSVNFEPAILVFVNKSFHPIAAANIRNP
jgi:hypothetical protein